MSDDGTPDDLLLDGELAPPMANGEVLFAAPWQGRVFGMARVLCEAGCFSWDEFRAHLITQVGAWDRSAAAGSDYHYYDHFLAALQALLVAKRVLDPSLVERRVRAFAGRPHGHDHDH